jgi:Protein of unknown function (DUF3306)
VADTDSKQAVVKDGLSLSRWMRLRNERNAKKSSESISDEITCNSPNNLAIDDKAIRVPDSAIASAPGAQAPEETLPSLDSVSLANDFTPFMQTKVPEALKRQALKALFKETHFNTMDGLDIYIGDYTKFEPISPEEMAGLSSWKSIMKPLEQVVTPGGYAVDVESEEGKAVLAARAELARANGVTKQEECDDAIPPAAARETGEGDGEEQQLVAEQTPHCDAIELTPNPALTSASLLQRAAAEGAMHPRYGKRVGDFKSGDVPLHIEETVAAGSVSSATRHLADDPR